MFLVDLQLCVAYCTTVGPPVAVNINFCGYLQFLVISFV
jgi:hypothetical protein